MKSTFLKSYQVADRFCDSCYDYDGLPVHSHLVGIMMKGDISFLLTVVVLLKDK